jgi:hypothetical protein
MLKKIIIFSCAVFLMSCGSNTTDNSSVSETGKDNAKKDAPAQPENELADFKFHTLVINIPSPFEMITLAAKAGIPFKDGLVNGTGGVSKYVTSTKRGLNYGVYIVDLAYLSNNEHFSEVKNYFRTSQELAQNLGFAESFDRIVGPRVEKNVDKKDTVNKIIDQVYIEMDKYLRSNDRLLTSTQILVGSWVESQYIIVSVLKDVPPNSNNKILFEKLKEQNFTSQKLVELLKEYEKEKNFKATVDGIKELDKLFSGAKGKDLDKETLQKIYAKLTEVRDNIVN